MGGVLRIVKCGRGLLLTATAASTTELKQIALQVAAKLLVTSKQSDCNTQKKNAALKFYRQEFILQTHSNKYML